MGQVLLISRPIDSQPSPADLPSVDGDGANGLNGQGTLVQQSQGLAAALREFIARPALVLLDAVFVLAVKIIVIGFP